MALTDHYTRHALVAAGIQIAAFLGVMVYGLAAPSLGAHLVLPILTMLPVLAAVLWLTLRRPWDCSLPRIEDGWGSGRGAIWDPGVVAGATYAAFAGHTMAFQDAKERLLELRGMPRSALAAGIDPSLRSWGDTWAADTWGHLLVTDTNVVYVVFLPVVALGMLWALLPR